MEIKHENLWDIAKAVPRGTFIALNAFISNKENSQINNLSSYLKNLGKEQK